MASREISPSEPMDAVVGGLEFTDEQRRMIRDTFAGGATDEEFAVLMEIARARRLNPLFRQIHFVSRWDSEKHRPVWAAQVSIDGLRAIAERTGLYQGQDEPEFIESEDGTLKLCKVRVYRKDWPRPAVGIAYWAEYVQTIRDKATGKTRPAAMWARMPHVMLAKCLPGNAQIETDRGPIRIANIVNQQLKVQVRSIDLKTGREVWKPVVKGWRNGGTDRWVKLWAPNGTHGNRCIRVTPDHPIWTPRGWVPAGELKVGDSIAVASPTLNDAQEQVLLGSLMGDASLQGRATESTCPAFNESHATRQSEYLLWKSRAFANLRPTVRTSTLTVKGVAHEVIHLRTRSAPLFWEYRKLFYPGGVKQVSAAVLSRLSDLGLAVWIMDDGSLKADRRWPSRPRLGLYTCCFPVAQQQLMAEFFASRFKVTPRVSRPEKNPFLSFSADDTERLLEHLKRYIAFDRAANDKQWVAADVTPGASDGMVFVPVLRTEIHVGKEPEGRYDIEVEGTHTFLYNNIVVSNCAESLAFRKAFPEDMSGLYTGEEMSQSHGDLSINAAAPRGSVARVLPQAPSKLPSPEETFAMRVSALRKPEEAVALWIDRRDALALAGSAVRNAAWRSLGEQVEALGQKDGRAWLRHAVAEEDARREGEVQSLPSGPAPSSPAPDASTQGVPEEVLRAARALAAQAAAGVQRPVDPWLDFLG